MRESRVDGKSGIVDSFNHYGQCFGMDALSEAAGRLEALGSPVRLSIYRLLVRAGAEGRPVGQIQSSLEIPPSTLSHHLKHLESVGLIVRRKQGTTHFCCANYAAMDALIAFLSEECCVEGSVPQGADRGCAGAGGGT